MKQYDEIQRRLARGWNTWNARSVLSYVLLPEALAYNLGIKEYSGWRYLKEANIGRPDQTEARVFPGLRSYDGRYTELTLSWHGVELRVQSGTEGGDLVVLVTPLPNSRRALVTVESGILWNRPGYLTTAGDALVGHLPTRVVHAWATSESINDPSIAAQTPFLAMPLDGPVGLSTGKRRDVTAIKAILERERAAVLAARPDYGDLSEVCDAIQTVIAWDTVYEPEHARVVSPVSRMWCVGWGGYVLFDWDTYFAAYLASVNCKELAYVNAVEITREKTEQGFVPNFGTVGGVKSRDRSQPPVGALVFRELYRRYRETWLLELVFDDLLQWNRWWPQHRDWDGLLCWGSEPYEPVVGADLELHNVSNWQAAALESGLDNSPMYDGVPFDEDCHLMALADVGLMGLYVMDCDALHEIARVLGRTAEALELSERAERYRQSLASLWDERTGMFLNRRMDTGEPSPCLSPTNLYALLGRAASPAQAQRMVAEHMLNPDEFWGEWVLPTTPRNQPGYSDQYYWRGRIWAPTNFLAYLGLRNYCLPEATSQLAARSVRLLLKEWRERGHIHENYNADSGEGCDSKNSDAFYHWGALFGLMALIDAGHLPAPEEPLIQEP